MTPLVTRQTRPDAETPQALHLIKNTAELRPTRQIRLNALRAAEMGKKLILHVPAACRFHPALEQLIQATDPLIKRQDLP